MSIQPWYHDAAYRLAGVACAIALLLTACGGGSDNEGCGDGVCDGSETASSCAADCGCGNGIVNTGEECDRTDLGAGTCMDAVQRGGTLRCNADCTFDVTGCTLASCGNGVVEDGEACDGTDLGGRSCSGVGFVGGDLACKTDCVYDVSTCCMDACPTAGEADCVGDVLRVCGADASGCLAWQVTDCTATDEVCEGSAGTASCTCVDRCTAGETRCEAASIETCQTTAASCLDWVPTTNCGASNGTCATAPSGPICVANVSAEDCADPYVLSAGENAVAWTAVDADYLTAPSCDTSLVGPDLVLKYTAPDRGFVRITMAKPTQRQVMVVSSAACGTVTPELACSSGTAATLSSELAVTMGTTYYVYVRDTSSGTAPLANPLFVTVEETLCSAIGTITPTLSPAPGTSIPDPSPVFSVDLTYPINPSAGVITVTGSLGTNLTFDLATAPDAIAFVNGGRKMIIDPGIVFPEGESVTVSWTGLLDASCGAPIASPTWTFVVGGPSCGPGRDGMVGNTVTRVATGRSTSPTESYIAVDSDPNGYVYWGGASDLFRTPKAGVTSLDIEAAAGLTAAMLGEDMLMVGSEIYSLESTTSAFTSNLLWRLSTDGGATWNPQNYMQLPQVPNDALLAISHHNGRLYLVTQSLSDAAEIWSVAAGATTLPQLAVLEATIPNEDADTCSGLAVDDAYFYLACSGVDRLVRVDRVTLAVELITDKINFGSSKNALHAHDLDGNGRADVLYISSEAEEARYVCAPSGPGPFFTAVLANFGTTTSGNLGLGFDRANNVLWMYDDDTRELIKIQ